ncbi:hypothetical protein QBC40DRAFT_273359 [Triangularia verruculosa]|uniref:Protein YIP n=1 Tax=Triangularia verruculosa TaxID=2587418 RepID=A0AAN6XQZ8_9PEZI|nr:hypothetical protein QBC40DRAFT_273359 [Triangularia verruculosa]
MSAPNRSHYQSTPQVDLENNDEDINDLIDPDDADLNSFDDPLGHQPSSSSSRPLPSGNISSTAQTATAISSRWGLSGEDRPAPLNTIDEPVSTTLLRDLSAIWSKLKEVLYPKYLFGGTMTSVSDIRNLRLAQAREEIVGLASRAMDADSLLSNNHMSSGLRDWDLWGPLVFCLLLSTLLSFKSREAQKEVVFSGVFAMVWIGMGVVTVQIRLLGGNISFAQSVCIIGYTLFPLVIAAMLSALSLVWFARIPVYLVLVGWSLAAGVSILGGSGVVKNRVGLAVYPLAVFYFALGCLCFIS